MIRVNSKIYFEGATSVHGGRVGSRLPAGSKRFEFMPGVETTLTARKNDSRRSLY